MELIALEEKVLSVIGLTGISRMKELKTEIEEERYTELYLNIKQKTPPK